MTLPCHSQLLVSSSYDYKWYKSSRADQVDLTDKSGKFGLTVLTDCKNGSDKPDDHTLRLTLLRSPGTRGGYEDQASQDWGHHEFVYGIAGHGEDWRKGKTDWEAERLNQPLIGFASSKHAGGLGKEFSLLKVSNSRVRVLAMKKAEASNEVVVRLVELDGAVQNGVHLHFPSQIVSAREINGAEEPVGPAQLVGGDLVTDFTGYQPRSFAVKLAAAPVQLASVPSESVDLPYDQAVATKDGNPTSGSFDNGGKALPAEMLPESIAYDGIRFRLAPAGTGFPDAVRAQGQTVPLPAGNFNTVYFLMASADGDKDAVFHIGDHDAKVSVQDWGGFIGQWDSRQWKIVEKPTPDEPKSDDKSAAAEHARRVRAYVKENGPITADEFVGLTPAFIKPAAVAWFASHRHDSAGNNEPYSYSYLFAYRISVPAGAMTLQLPRNKDIKVLAVSVATEADEVTPVQPLYDTFPSSVRTEEK